MSSRRTTTAVGRSRSTRLESTLSEEETYGRLVEHGGNDLLVAQSRSPKPLIAEHERFECSPGRDGTRFSASDALWMEVLNEAEEHPNPYLRSPGGSDRPLNGPTEKKYALQDQTRSSCVPFRAAAASTGSERSTLPTTSAPPSTVQSPLDIIQHDESPTRSRRSHPLAAASDIPNTSALAGRRLRQKARRMSSILNSFTCDLMATNIEYEVPVQQPSVLSRAKDATMQRMRNAASGWHGACCQDLRDAEMYDVEGAAEERLSLSDPEAEPQWRKVLNGISLEARPGKMIAILGGSGSGKTSFLDVLSGRSPPNCRISGKLTINGADVRSGSEELKFCVGYVTQHLFLLPMLTVEETLRFVALLRLPKTLTNADKSARVSDVISYLGLDPLRKRLIGGEETKGLSGGQQRLVAIATQMIYNPGVLILDEPTSGLDSYTAEHVCKTLHDLAMKRSRAILLTIHQPGPEITQLFDHVLILSSGHTIYNGPADQLVRYFNSLGYTLPEFTNPCDYYVDLATLDTRSAVREQHSRSCFQFLINAYIDFKQDLWEMDEESDSEGDDSGADIGGGAVASDGTFNLSRWIPAMTPTHPSRRQITSFASRHMIHRRRTQFLSQDSLPKTLPAPPESVNALVKFGILLRRTVRNELRDSSELLNQVFQAALLSLLFGLVFIQLGDTRADLRNRKAILFISFTLYPFMAVFETIAKYAGQQMMVFQEMVNGLYTSTPFGAAKILGELPGSIILSVTYSIPLYFMSSLRLEVYAYFRFLLLVFLLLQIARMMALGAGVITQSPNYAALAANLLFTGWILTAGYIININNLWDGVQWIAFISPIRYAFQAAALTELEGRNFSSCAASGPTTNYSASSPATSSSCPAPLRGDADLADLAFDTLTYQQCVAILLGMYATAVAVVIVAMRVRSRTRPE